jgi:hypothetical protein
MKGIWLILILIALLVGGYLVYRNLSAHTGGPEDSTRIRAIEKAREGAELLRELQQRHLRAAEGDNTGP